MYTEMWEGANRVGGNVPFFSDQVDVGSEKKVIIQPISQAFKISQAGFCFLFFSLTALPTLHNPVSF